MSLYGARVEYGLHTLLNLSFAPDGTAPSARDLAEFQRLPMAFIRKLLTQLEKTGLIRGSEGVHGGWRLARDPAQITVLEVAEAAQGRQPLFACAEIRANCALWPKDRPPAGATEGVCSIHAVMLSAEAAMRRELAGQTLADIIRQVGTASPSWVTVDSPNWFATRMSSRRTSRSPQSEK